MTRLASFVHGVHTATTLQGQCNQAGEHTSTISAHAQTANSTLASGFIIFVVYSTQPQTWL